MRRPTTVVALVVATICGTPKTPLADRGAMPFDPNVEIYEPKQDAIIAWNGREEILLLGTELRASASTKVLEVLPLPAQPRVGPGNTRAFRQLKRIIERHLRARRRRPSRARAPDLGDPFAGRQPAAKVTQRKRIGAHHITVVKLLDGARFVAWVEAHLKRRGVDAWQLPARFRAVIESYISDGFRWFVFDVVSVGPKTRTVRPIRYRFRTDYLFYPMRITSLAQGSTSINLGLLTPRRLRRFPRLPVRIDEAWVPAAYRGKGRKALCDQDLNPLTLSAAEVRSVSKEISGLLGGRRTVLDVIACHGNLSAFDRDLVATW